MNYNETITAKLPNIINTVMKMVDKFSDNYKITDWNINITDCGTEDPSSYISAGTTAYLLVEVNYVINGTEEKEFYLEVPKMINDLFIISGSYKLVASFLNDSKVCIRSDDYYRFQFGFSYKISTGEITVFDADDGDSYTYPSLKELVKDYPDIIKLTEEQSWKLKTQLDLDKLPTRVTQSMLNKLNTVSTERTSLDKYLVTIDRILLGTLRDNQLDITKEIQHNFYKYGTISAKPFQQVINEVFYNQRSDLKAINNVSNVNPYSISSLNSKVILETNVEGITPQKLNENLYDLIDPIATPDNANVNRLNYLNSCVSSEEGQIFYEVYDKDFNKIKIPYYVYTGSRVVESKYVDYRNKRVVKVGSKYIVKYNGKRDIESTTYDYINLEPDARLSILTRNIPMVNYTDSTRSGMASRFEQQAIPLVNPDTPRVLSGHENELDKDVTSIKYLGSEEGIVVDVTKLLVRIADSQGIVTDYNVPMPKVGIYDITSVFVPIVKVGDKVRKNQVIITNKINSKGTINTGLNALTALMVYRGYNYEDAVIISESFSKRLTHYSTQDLFFKLKDTDLVTSVAPIGSVVNSGDIIAKLSTEFSDYRNVKLIKLLIDRAEPTKVSDIVVPTNITNGVIVDIQYSYNKYAKMVQNKMRYELNEDSIEVLKNIRRISMSVSDDYVSEIPELPSYEGYAAIIGIRLLIPEPAQVGDKIANRYGSKGTISIIVPDNEMVRLPNGQVIDCIFNPDAVFARKNIAQVYEMNLAKICDKLLNMYRSSGDLEEFKINLNKYKLYEYLKKSDEELTSALDDPKFILNYTTGAYSDINPKDIYKWMNELGISQDEYVIDGKTGRRINNPVAVSYMYVNKLQSLAKRADKYYSDDAVTLPVLGKGKLRHKGLKQGEMETAALLAHDLVDFTTKARSKLSINTGEDLAINFLLAGVKITEV